MRREEKPRLSGRQFRGMAGGGPVCHSDEPLSSYFIPTCHRSRILEFAGLRLANAGSGKSLCFIC